MKSERLQTPFAESFSNPPVQYRGLDILHFFRHRRSFGEIWHHLPANPKRTLRSLEGKNADIISYGPHPELNPDRGIRGDLRCILPFMPRIEDLDELVRGGVGGFAGNVAWSPEYPYDPTDWNDFREALEYCRQHGLEVWFYDEAGYPSGHANQRTFEGHPEYMAQGLQWTQQTSKGPGIYEMPLPEGTLFTAIAVAEDHDTLDGNCQRVLPAKVHEDRVEVTVPEGQWRVFIFTAGPVWKSTHADFLNIHYLNILDGSAVRRFIDLTHEVYLREAGPWFGSTITGVFTDEPSLMSPIQPSMEDGQFHDNLPWVSDLPEVFKERTGYSLLETLPALVADVGSHTVKRRCDFWDTITHLVSTRCYRQIGDWCASHGIAYTGHLLWEEKMSDHVPLHGNMMECLRWFSWPGYDALRSVTREEDPDSFAMRTLGAKYVTSAAHLYNKPHTMCETFGVTEPRPLAIYEHILDVLVLLGLERHGYYSIWDKLTTEEKSQLNTHLGRVSLAGFYGTHRCEAAILYPIVAAWAHHNASKHEAERSSLDTDLIELSQGILDRQMDFDFCDDDSLQKGTAIKGRWQINEESYRVLLVPPMSTMRLTTLQALERAQCEGVKVIFSGMFPCATVEEGPDASLKDWCHMRFGEPVPVFEAADRMAEAADERPIVTPESRSLWIGHRQSNDSDRVWTDIFLIVNTIGAGYTGDLILPIKGTPYWCDVDTGIISPAGSSSKRNGMTVPLDITGYGIKIVVVKAQNS